MNQVAELSGRSLLVLGAGYVGAEFVRRAVANGMRVSALTRNQEKAAELRAVGGVQVVEADLAGAEWHRALPGPFEHVVNCVSAGGGGVAGYRHSYLDGMRSVAAWLRAQPPGGTIAYTSSTGVYPQGDGVSVDETAPLAGAGENGAILREAEQVLAAGAEAARWRWFVLRLAGIYGPGRHGMLDQLRAGEGNVSGDPSHHMNLIHRDDACGALRAALAAPATVAATVFNVTDGASALRGEVAAWLAARLGVPAPVFAPSGRTSGTSPFGGGRRAPDRIVVAEKIRRSLGWQPEYPDFRSGYEMILAGCR